jgi:hypothetical protein
LRAAGDDGDASFEIDGVGHGNLETGRCVHIVSFFTVIPGKCGEFFKSRRCIEELPSSNGSG